LSWKGIAVVNTGTQNTQLILEAYGEGRLLATTTVTLDAENRLVGLHSNWFPDIPVSRLERIVIQSNYPFLQGITISGDTENSSLAFAPALSKPNFTP